MKELVNGSFDGLEFVNTFNGNNLPFYKKIALFYIDTFFVNVIAVTMIAEIRTDQYIEQSQNSQNQADPFADYNIRWKQPEITDGSQYNENDYAADETGGVHTIERIFRQFFIVHNKSSLLSSYCLD